MQCVLWPVQPVTDWFYAFQQKKQAVAVKAVLRESLLCLSGQLRVARIAMPQALAQIGQKSRYDYLSQFYIFVSENLEQHTYSGFWETWAAGIDSYVRDIYLTESDSEILKNIGSIPLPSGHSDAACVFGRKYFGTGQSD